MSLGRTTLLVTLAAALSRILGFVRDILIAQVLGAGAVADAFLLSFRLPNLVRRVLGEGGLNASFVPLYLHTKNLHGETEVRKFTQNSFAVFAIFLVVLIAFIEIMAGFFVLMLAFGYQNEAQVLDLAALYTRLSFPFIFGAVLASLGAAVLTAEHHFTASSIASCEVNALLIIVLLVLEYSQTGLETRAIVLAASLSIAGLVQVGSVWWIAKRQNISFVGWKPRFDKDIQKLCLLTAPALLASGAAQLIVLAGTQAASFIPSAISWLYYADRLIQLPLGFVSVALGQVLLPNLATKHLCSDEAGFIRVQNRALELGWLLVMPASIALAVLAEPVARILFEGGAFYARDSQGVALALQGLSPALVGAVTGKVFSQAFLARGNVRTPCLAALVGIFVTLVACPLLSHIWGVFGLGLGISAGLAAHAIFLGVLLWKQNLWSNDHLLITRTIRIVAASMIMAAGLFMMRPFLAFAKMPGLFVICIAGIVLYGLAALLLKAVDRQEIVQNF